MNTMRNLQREGGAPLSKFLRLLLAITLLLSESTRLLAAQDLWSDRRRAAQHVRSGHVSSVRPSPWEKLAASFPSIEKGSPLPLPGPTEKTPLPDWLESSVSLYADVGESHLPTRGERRVLIHIQDLHEVEEAQRNAAAVLEQLAACLGGKPGLLVGLEGASGGFRTADFRALASPPIIRRAADRLLKAGTISGPEFFSLTTRKRFRLWGIEDASSYADNIRAFTDTIPFQTKDDATVARAITLVEKLKEQLYPPLLKELDQVRARYDDGRIGLAAYVQRLSQGAPKEAVGPSLHLFLDAVSQESDLSLARVAQDQARLLETLAPRLDESEVKQLVETGLSHRMGRVSFSRFFALLSRVCGKHNVSLSAYPALVGHAAYAVKAEAIHPSLLLRDIDTLTDRSLRSLLTSSSLVELAALNDDLRLIEKLNRFSLVPEEYQKLLLRRAEIKRWHKRGAALGAGMGVGGWPDLSPVMERHSTFYLQAERRNGPLVQNLFPQWGDGSPAVLVAGGYHADGVRAEALARGLGYISLIPRITSIENLPPPLASFRSKGKKNEWVFRGNQSGLHRPLQTAVGSKADSFAEQFVAVVAGEITVSMAATENPLGTSFVSHLNLALDQMADSAKRFGWDLTFDVRPVEKVEGEISVAVNFSSRDRDSLSTASVRGATTVVLSGRRAGTVMVGLHSPALLASLLERWGFGVAESAILRWINAGRQRASVWSARIIYELGRNARATAVVLVNPLRSLGFNWLVEGVKGWTQNLRLGEDRRMVRVALQMPLGFQVALLQRVAEAHRVPMRAEWRDLLLGAVKDFVPVQGQPNVALLSSLPDPLTLSVQGKIGETPVRIEFGVSNASALIENPGSHSPFQMVKTPEGVFRVLFQMPSVSNAGILPMVMGGVLREITGLLADESVSVAHTAAFSPRERQLLEGHFLAYLLQSSGAAMDTDIMSSINKDSYTMAKPTLQLKTRAVTADELKDPGQVIDFTQGPEPIRSQLEARFGLWDTFIGEHDDLTGNIRGMKILATYFESRGTLFDFFPSFGNKARLLELASDLVYNRLSSVGGEQGRRASETRVSLQEALAQNASNQFLVLAQSLLGFLSVSGVSFDREKPADAARFVDRMFRVYAAHFEEGYRQGQRGAADPSVELPPSFGGVLHLTGSVHQSDAAGQLLKNVMNRSPLGDFKMMVLSETGEDPESIVEALVARLENDFSDSPDLAAAVQSLRSADNLKVRKAWAFRVEGTISLEGVLNEFHSTWPGLAGVGVFTSRVEAFRQDVERSLLSWALIDGNGHLVSRAVEDAAFKQALHSFIRRQA